MNLTESVQEKLEHYHGEAADVLDRYFRQGERFAPTLPYPDDPMTQDLLEMIRLRQDQAKIETQQREIEARERAELLAFMWALVD
ncbi:hypothetical protein [Paludisphaera rhizosphaerae]|uniref:hypothetical protein n=1 Tax=Paludisphaera rhizosphaerae TaxID=2711216 RepID=UPI0013E9B471|nr:hypothetical protein [Paludisphaera rhizosphaerae]